MSNPIQRLSAEVKTLVFGLKADMQKAINERSTIYELAETLPVTSLKLWTWYSLMWQGDLVGFVECMVKAQQYAEAEGLEFEEVAINRMGVNG
jgi:hypothetical protein